MARKAPHPVREKCRNCGHVLSGDYCAFCGQPERDGHPPTLGHIVHDLTHEFLHIDGKIFRTLGALLFEPGRLTEEYWAGHVISWVRPIRIFLVIVFLHVLLSPGQGPLNHRIILEQTSGEGLRVNIVSGVIASEAIETYVPWYAEREEDTLPSEKDRDDFAHEFEKAYGVIRYASVVAFALAGWLLYHRQQPYFVNHLIGGLHFYSFWYAIAAFASLLARLNPLWNNLAIFAVVYLFLALGRLFHEPWYVRLWKTIALYLFVHLTELGLGYAASRWIESHA